MPLPSPEPPVMEPENRLTDADCPICNGTPCTCDRATDEYRDYLMERDL